MNLLLIEATELSAEGLVELRGRRAEHLRKVLRVSAGDCVKVGVVGGGRGQARIESIVRDEHGKKKITRVLAQVTLETAPRPRPEVDLIVGLPRPAVLHRVLQHIATFGVGRLDLTNAWKVEKSYFQSPAVDEQAIRRHLLLGAEQGGHTWLPEVSLHRLLVPFLDQLEDRGRARFLAHPEAEMRLEDAFEMSTKTAGALLAIGPEGGWVDREISTFEERGFVPVTFGPWILRTEAAITAALAQFALLQRQRQGDFATESVC